MTTAPDGYRTIAADPPWSETGGGGRGTGNHYATIRNKADILRVMVTAPCWRVAESAHLWLWATTTHLADAMWLMDALGFRYVTAGAWIKMTKHGTVATGMGQYIRHAWEPILFGVRGQNARKLSPAGHGYKDVIETPVAARRGRHSEKPAEMYRRIEQVSLGAPRLEMFARAPREGWDVFGNEVEGP
jgi:N6-adenosine-specific RNA methylase IME4